MEDENQMNTGPTGVSVAPPKITTIHPMRCGVHVDEEDGSVTVNFIIPSEVVSISLGPAAAGALKEALPSGSGLVPVSGIIHP